MLRRDGDTFFFGTAIVYSLISGPRAETSSQNWQRRQQRQQRSLSALLRPPPTELFQSRKRPVGRRLGGLYFKRHIGGARKRRQRQREFLGDRLSDVDRVYGQRLEGRV